MAAWARCWCSSQVVLSFQLPFAMWPLIRFTSSRAMMGGFANGPVVKSLAWLLFGVISAANVWLVATVVSGNQRLPASFHRCTSASGASASGTSKLTEIFWSSPALSTSTSTR